MTALRVLHVYRCYYPDPPGGVAEAIRQICLATSGHGVQSTIFTLSPSPVPSVLEQPEGQVVRARSWAAPASCDLGGPAAFLRFAARARQADVICYHFPWPFADLLDLVTRPKKPTVLVYHSDIVRQRSLGQIYAPLMRRMLSSVSAIVATSPTYAASSPVLSDQRWKAKVRTIPLGIVESQQQEDPRVLARLGLAEGQPFFLFLGALRYYKGLHTLVASAKRVNAPIVIAGSGTEGSALKEQSTRQGANNVLFAGQVSDAEKAALMRRCRAFVLPSHLRSEAYGMVLIEAAMAGRPLICCDIGSGMSFINAQDESGLLVPPENEQALAEAMNAMLNDPARAAQLGQGARARYEQLFSGAPLGSQYAALFNELANPS
ncbi:glycosyltransferase [Bordetella muralis]|jgi:glycosyltransferase involved in cell wall biosynthesis|uniref:glycosyltransferase n=1 Tax=Bordetella muralis TaxID=1649130 RepID=UPI0039EF0246